MSLAALPSSTPVVQTTPRRWVLWFAPLALIPLIVAGYWFFTKAPSATGGGVGVDAAQLYPVMPADFEVKVSQKGELQAVNNIDIVCQVEGQTAITTIVKEGSSVKKGQVLATLDSSAIKQKIEDATLDVQKADADLQTAREMKDIQDSQNAANLEAAQVVLDAAKLDFQAYVKGLYPQALQNAQTALEKAKITLKTKQETYAQTQNLFNKGFVTATDVKTSEIDVAEAGNAVGQAQTALDVLVQYTHLKALADKKTAVSQAEQKLVRTQRENAAN